MQPGIFNTNVLQAELLIKFLIRKYYLLHSGTGKKKKSVLCFLILAFKISYIFGQRVVLTGRF